MTFKGNIFIVVDVMCNECDTCLHCIVVHVCEGGGHGVYVIVVYV